MTDETILHEDAVRAVVEDELAQNAPGGSSGIAIAVPGANRWYAERYDNVNPSLVTANGSVPQNLQPWADNQMVPPFVLENDGFTILVTKGCLTTLAWDVNVGGVGTNIAYAELFDAKTETRIGVSATGDGGADIGVMQMITAALPEGTRLQLRAFANGGADTTAFVGAELFGDLLLTFS